MRRPVILSAVDFSLCPDSLDELSAIARVISVPPDRNVILSSCSTADAYIATLAVRVDGEFLAQARRLKIVASPATGTDHLELGMLERQGVKILTLANEFELLRSFTATSELAFGLMLALLRKLPPAISSASAGRWAREGFTGSQLSDKVLGVVGLGRLGAITARIGRGFGMRVVATDPFVESSAGVEMVPLNRLLEDADVVSLHLHLDESTRHLISRREFGLMKPSAILINTSRGGLVNEEHLLDALSAGQIAGAGVDVLTDEWQSDLHDSPIIRFARANENLIITPHIGGATVESIIGARRFTAKRLALELACL